MDKYIFDIETNGLMDTVHTVWMICLKALGEERYITFSDHIYDAPSISSFPVWVEANASKLIGHNICRYDLPVLQKLHGMYIPNDKVIDTYIMSLLNKFSRGRRHSLKAWGQHLGEPKGDFKAFDTYSDEMLTYCQQDLKVNEKVYYKLVEEAREIIDRKPIYSQALRLEHDMAISTARQVSNGWLFDFKGCKDLIALIAGKMAIIENTVEPLLAPNIRMIDATPKTPRYREDGSYHKDSARMIGEFLGVTVLPEDALGPSPPMAPHTSYQRSQVVPAGMGQDESVKAYLESLGVVWTQFNWKKKEGKFIKTSPKLNEFDVMRVDHPHCALVLEYNTLKSRTGILNGWMKQEGGDGRLRGEVRDIGTSCGRHSHKVMVNIPGHAAYGKEIRKLFITSPDKVLVSADGAAYHVRILAHYLRSQEYTDIVLNGDVHQRHADAMGVTRNLAKPIFFAVIYGAGASKIGAMLPDPSTGKAVLDKLIATIPGMGALKAKAKRMATTQGWVPGIDGRKVYVNESYKAINYLIQSAEAVLMKRTVADINQEFIDADIPYSQLLMYHDEVTFEMAPEYADRASLIIKRCFEDSPKKFGVSTMNVGDVKVGKDYYEVH